MKNGALEQIDSFDITSARCLIAVRKEKINKIRVYDMRNKRIFLQFPLCVDRSFLFIQILDFRRQKTRKKKKPDRESNASFCHTYLISKKKSSGGEKEKNDMFVACIRLHNLLLFFSSFVFRFI